MTKIDYPSRMSAAMLYKKFLRSRLDHLQKGPTPLRASTVAQTLGIEPSYLSRFFSDSQTHFSEDLLYRLTQQLQLTQGEVDHVWLLRDYDRASHPERRAYLEARIRAARLERFSPELERMQALVQNLQEALKNCNSSTSNI